MGRGGRGGALMQALLDKKKEEEENERKKAREQLIQEELRRQQQQQAEATTSAAASAPAGVSDQPPLRRTGTGRGGLLAALMSKATAAPGSAAVPPPPVAQPAAGAVIRQSAVDIKEAERKMEMVTKLSPSKETRAQSLVPQIRETAPSRSSSATAAPPPSQTAAQMASSIAARGRGSIMHRISSRSRVSGGESGTESGAEESTVTAHQSRRSATEIRVEKETVRVAETLASVLEVSSQLSSEHDVVRPKSIVTSAGGLGSGAAGTGSGGTGQTQATTTSYERALEELKVEHIMRKSPVRKVGDSGTQSMFGTNYIKLKCKNQGVYQYVVHYDPPVDSQYNRIKLLHQLAEVTGPVRLFDGFTLFLPVLLPEKVTSVKVKNRHNDSETFVKIQLTKILPPEQIPSTVFNIIFKNIMKELKMNRIGQHYFSSARQIDIPNHHLQIWPGYTTAVHEFEDGLYLVIDVAHKILRSQTCWHLMSDISTQCGRSMERFREEVFNQLIGTVVLTRYNNRTYRIDDIMWDENPLTTFNYHTGQITYYDYYKQHYNIEIKDLRQPLLLHRAKKTRQEPGNGNGNGKAKLDIVCLIPELCFVTGLSTNMKDDFSVKKDLATHTRLTPSQRCEQLNILIENIRRSPEALRQITNWGLELDDTLAQMDGRTLPREKIYFARREVETDNKCDWTKPACNEEVLKAIELKHWVIAYPYSKEQTVERFVTLAMEVSRRMGIRINMPITVPLRDDRADTYYTEIKKNLSENVQLVCAVFPMLSDSRYTRIKKLCCLEYPVPSQVVVLKTISKADNVLKTVAQKIVLQMNCKLGGELWRLAIPIKKVMIVGIDVYHKIEKKYKSIAGFVSSLNSDQTRWYSKVCFQMVGQELTDTLKIAFTQALKKYQEENNCLPEKIIIYRDGVSEGQLSVVSDHEVVQLKSCFASDYHPQMSVIVVQKRINTRIFSILNRAERGNPIPGAVVDHTITSRDKYDFFLVSQHVGQGTVTPTHYVVVYDDTNLKADHVQRLSYKMTHLYYNWSGTIRVPAPCQYAHKLAFLTGQYLQEESSTTLCDKLFYL